MNPDRPHLPLTPSKAGQFIDDAQRFSKDLPDEERDRFLRNVAWAVIGSLVEGIRA